MDEEQSLHIPLSGKGYLHGVKTGDFHRKLLVPKSIGLCGYVFQIVFQVYLLNTPALAYSCTILSCFQSFSYIIKV